MRCTAVMRNGAQCTVEALDGLEWCYRHRAMEMRRENRAFYRARLSREDREALAEAAAMVGLGGEVALLRVLMRRAAGAGDIDAFRLALDTLRRLMKTQQDLEQLTSRGLASELERVLDELALEEEQPV